MPKKTRTSPNFSRILTPDSPARTISQIEVIDRQFEDCVKDTKTIDPLKLKFDELKIASATPKRNVYLSTALVKRSKKDTAKSTSQNHIISDHYIQKILDKCVSDINDLSTYKDKNSPLLMEKKKDGVLAFLGVIFHGNEANKLTTAKKLFIGCIEDKAPKSIKAFSQFVASNGSNNAVEGNASVNSGVSKHMDAPVDSQGKLLRSFEIIRNAFIELGNVTSLTLTGRDVVTHKLVIDAITPDLHGYNIRSSSLVYKEQKSINSFEAPAATMDYKKNFHTGKNNVAIDTKKPLSPALKTHLQNGYIFPRKSSLPTSTLAEKFKQGAMPKGAQKGDNKWVDLLAEQKDAKGISDL